MRIIALPSIGFLALLVGCEVADGAKSTPPKITTAEPQPNESEKAKADADRRAREAEDSRRKAAAAEEERKRAELNKNTSTRIVDARRPPPIRQKSDAPVIPTVVDYSDPGTPTPFSPPAGKLVVSRQVAPIQTPAVRSELCTSIVIEASDDDAGWEVALLRKGATILDRTMLPLLERELYLQEAMASEQDGSNLSSKKPSMFPNLKVVGRDPYDFLMSRYWVRAGGQTFFPILSGRSVPASSRLPVGMAESATAVLRIEKAEADTSSYSGMITKPVSKSVAYVPQFGSEVALAVDGASWQRDANDPWLYHCKNALVYLDPATNALWRIDRAWLGGPVTRDAWIQARTRTDSQECSGCRRPLPNKTKVEKPDAQSTPATWWCAECNRSKDVNYFDGYADPRGLKHYDHAVVEWEWVPPSPGIYPLLTPPAGHGLSQSFELGGNGGWAAGDLANSLAPTNLLSANESSKWSWVRPDGSAVVFEKEEWQSLLQGTDSAKQAVRLPVCDPSGTQVYGLEREPFETLLVSVPVERFAVPVRMALTATTRLVMAGNFALDYRNLLVEDVEISVGADGPDLSNWPNTQQQRAELRKRVMELLADTIVK